MDDDTRAVLARGLRSRFWRIYVAEVLEPEKELVRAALLKQGPPESGDLPKISYYRGANAILERLEKKMDAWLA